MNKLETLKAQMQNLLAMAQEGHDVWEQMEMLSSSIRIAEAEAQQQKEAELQDHGFSLVCDGNRVATATTIERAKILSVAMLQAHEDWTSIYVWKYGHEDEGRADAVASANRITRRIYWSPSTGG
jgi:hypothetical protein